VPSAAPSTLLSAAFVASVCVLASCKRGPDVNEACKHAVSVIDPKRPSDWLTQNACVERLARVRARSEPVFLRCTECLKATKSSSDLWACADACTSPQDAACGKSCEDQAMSDLSACGVIDTSPDCRSNARRRGWDCADACDLGHMLVEPPDPKAAGL
jgi:hypothetical protein